MQEIYTVQSAIFETELLTHTISALVLKNLNSVSPLGIYKRQSGLVGFNSLQMKRISCPTN